MHRVCENHLPETFPGSTFHSLVGLEYFPDEQLALLSKLLIPFGGLRRAGLQAGQTLIVHGATGYFASTALMLGLAMGAERIVAAARNSAALEKLAEILGQRVVPVEMTGKLISILKISLKRETVEHMFLLI